MKGSNETCKLNFGMRRSHIKNLPNSLLFGNMEKFYIEYADVCVYLCVCMSYLSPCALESVLGQHPGTDGQENPGLACVLLQSLAQLIFCHAQSTSTSTTMFGNFDAQVSPGDLSTANLLQAHHMDGLSQTKRKIEGPSHLQHSVHDLFRVLYPNSGFNPWAGHVQYHSISSWKIFSDLEIKKKSWS